MSSNFKGILPRLCDESSIGFIEKLTKILDVNQTIQSSS